MKNPDQFIGMNVLVLGLAKSGFAAANVLHKAGANVTVNDTSEEVGNEDIVTLRKLGVTVICGGHPEGILEQGFELLVKNPGIPYSNPVITEAIRKGIPVWTEIELASRISKAPIVAITGSNGKTTTTTLLYHMLNIGKKKPLIAGNIGVVSCAVAENATEENIIVLEASSFQLMGTERFHPHIAVWTNLYDAHIDYHGSSQAYAQAKSQVTKNQTEQDFFIYNDDQLVLTDIAYKSAATSVPFSLKGKKADGISADEMLIYWNGEPYVKRSIIKLPGQHNLENILAATAAAILLKCDKSAIESVLSSFTGVRHRMQYVKELNGRTFYNDSKATNTLATKSALAAFEIPTILLAGGLDRGQSFEELRPYMSNVKAVVALGETAGKIIDFAISCGVNVVIEAEDVQDAVNKAFPLSEVGDIILLSPSCASWDQYANFEIRGDQFIEAVMAL